jgi:hypothetical protein
MTLSAWKKIPLPLIIFALTFIVGACEQTVLAAMRGATLMDLLGNLISSSAALGRSLFF